MIQEILNLWMEKKGFFLGLLAEHIQISMTAILIAGILGMVIGILISEFQKTSRAALSVINFIYTIPSISMLGFLIPFSGIGDTTAIIALTVYGLLPMVRNTHTGLCQVSPAVIEAARGMGSTRGQILYKIKLPLALPVIMSGIRNMAVMTIALAGIASFIGAGGLGVAIYRGITTNNKAMTMIGSLLIALLALLVDLVLGWLEKRRKHRSHAGKRWKTAGVLTVLALGITVFVISLVGKHKGDTLRIATKPMTEQYILGEMLHTLVEQDTDLTVEVTQGVGGGTSNIQPGMESKEFDLYPEYTGTGWNQVLKKDGLYTEALFSKLQEEYREMGMTWEGMVGFNNTYGIAVRNEIAEEYGLETYSDLQKAAGQLTFGAEYDFFEREDGFDALCKKYNLNFGDTMDMDIGLKYDAVNQKKIDAMVVFTTDGQLSVSDIKVLKDDKNLYPSYTCGMVVREEVLEKYPKLQEILDRLAGQISDKEMAEMNYQVETEQKEPKEVAEAFLREKGLLE